MIDLISVDEAKQHVHVTGTRHDEDIYIKTMAASAILLNFLKVDFDASPLSLPWGDADVPWDIKAATMLIFGELFYHREGKESDPLSPFVKNLLHRWRDAALA